MATKKAARKRAKKATTRAKSPKVWKMTIVDNGPNPGSFLEDPLDGVKNGDHVKITIPPHKVVTITLKRIEGDPERGAGGPIVITS